MHMRQSSSYQELFQVHKSNRATGSLIHHCSQKLAAGIGDSRTMVPENILEEMDEDMNSNNEAGDEEEEKVP